MDFLKNQWLYDTFATWSPLKKACFILFLWSGIIAFSWHLKFKNLLATITHLKEEVTELEHDQKQAAVINKKIATIQNAEVPLQEISLVTLLEEISRADIKLIEYKKIKYKMLEHVFDISLQSNFENMMNLFEKLSQFRIVILKSDLKRLDNTTIQAMLRISLS